MKKTVANSYTDRLLWIDSLKYLAAFWILFVHFLFGRFPEYTQYLFSESLVAVLLKGLSGKLCVALFCVILGFFAFEKPRNAPCAEYVIDRYCRFVRYIFVTNAAKMIYLTAVYCASSGYMDHVRIYLVETNGIERMDWSLLFQSFFSDTFFLTSGLIATYWCLPAFFFGSLVVYIVGFLCLKNRYGIFMQCVSVLFFYFICAFAGQVWVANCVLGGLLRVVCNARLAALKKWYVLLPLFFAMIFAYRWSRIWLISESNFLCLAYGWASAILMLLCYNVPAVQHVLNLKFLSVFCGKVSYELFLVHPVVLAVFTVRCMKWGEAWQLSTLQIFIVNFCGTFLFSMLGAYALHCSVRYFEKTGKKWRNAYHERHMRQTCEDAEIV
jgi:peptidoglycan/LPS O-acetylase OafA/YrhL